MEEKNARQKMSQKTLRAKVCWLRIKVITKIKWKSEKESEKVLIDKRHKFPLKTVAKSRLSLGMPLKKNTWEWWKGEGMQEGEKWIKVEGAE